MRMSFSQLYIFAELSPLMPAHRSKAPKIFNRQKNRVFRRFFKNIFGTDSDDTRHRRSSSSHVSDAESAEQIMPEEQKASFWGSLFDSRHDWKTRFTGEEKKRRVKHEPVFAEKSDVPTVIRPKRHHRKKKEVRKTGFFKHLFLEWPRLAELKQNVLNAVLPKSWRVEHSPVKHKKKRKKSIFKRIFRNRIRIHKKVVLPSDEPVLPANKIKGIIFDHFPYFVNSTLMFLLAYLAAWLTYQAAVILTSSFFHIDSVLFFFEVMFPVGNSSALWTNFNIITITISGPITSVVAATIYYYFIVRRNLVKGNTLLFFNWLIIHSFCMFFAAFVAGVVTNQGFGYVANWMYMNVFFKILFSLIFLFVLSFIGFKGAKHLLETSNSIARTKSKNRVYFLISQTILPWFVSSFLLIAIKYPSFAPQHENILVYDAIIIASVLFMIIPPIFNKKAQPSPILFRESRKPSHINKLSILMTLFVIVIFRVGLSGGLHIIIHFMMDISRYR